MAVSLTPSRSAISRGVTPSMNCSNSCRWDGRQRERTRAMSIAVRSMKDVPWGTSGKLLMGSFRISPRFTLSAIVFTQVVTRHLSRSCPILSHPRTQAACATSRAWSAWTPREHSNRTVRSKPFLYAYPYSSLVIVDLTPFLASTLASDGPKSASSGQ
jgi:hypothetical protein